MNPVSRRADVVVQEIGGETIVYDRLSDAAHALDPVAARVFRSATGERSVAELAALVSAELGVARDGGATERALRELEAADLLERAASGGAAARRLGRRQVLRRLAAAAVVPMVASIAVPAPLMAQSRNGGPNPSQGPKPKPPKPRK
jgi:hypothetical protein